MKATIVCLSVSSLLSLIALTGSGPASAQGMLEYGNLLGGSPRGGPGGLGDTLKNLYGRGAVPPPTAPRVSAGEAAQYATTANASYTAALNAQKSGKLDVALKQYSNAIAIRERIWGTADPAIADIARRQAEIYRKQNNMPACTDAYRKVLASESRHFGSDSPQLIKTLETLGTLCEQQSNTHDALNYYKQLYGIKSRTVSPDSPDLEPLRSKIAALSPGAPAATATAPTTNTPPTSVPESTPAPEPAPADSPQK